MGETKKTFFSYENKLIIIMFFAYGLVWMDRYSVIYLFPFISKEMALTNTDLGALMSILAITWGASSVIFSFLSDKMGSKKLFLVASIFVFSLSTFLSGLATVFTTLFILRAVMGVAEGPAIPLIQSTVMAESSPKRRGFNLAFVLGGAALLGKGVTPILTTQIAAQTEWRYAFYTLGGFGILIAIGLMFFLKEPDVGVAKKQKPTLADYKIILMNRNIIVAIFAAILYMAFMFSFTTFLPQFLIEIGGYSEVQSGTILSLFGLILFIWNLVVATTSDKIGRRPTTIIFSFISCLIPISVIFLYGNYWFLLISLLLSAAGLGYQTLIMFVIPGESVSQAVMATATALIILLGEVVGGSFGPYVAGVLADKYSLFAPMWFSVILSFLLFLVVFGFKETLPQKIKQNS